MKKYIYSSVIVLHHYDILTAGYANRRCDFMQRRVPAHLKHSLFLLLYRDTFNGHHCFESIGELAL